MAILVSSQPISIATGHRDFTAVNVPDGLRECFVTLKYQSSINPALWTNPATTISAVASFSSDGGVSFRPLSNWGTNGGPHTDNHGTEVIETTWGFMIPVVPNRQFRLQTDVVNGPLNSILDVVVI